MKKTKKIISLLLSVLMIITSIPLMAVNSFAADEFYSGDYIYIILDDGTAEIKKYYNDDATEFTVPSEVNGYKVTSIGDFAFAYRDNLKKITISDGITNIGEWAFDDCYSLQSIVIPDSVAAVGECAFMNCVSLPSVKLPSGVTSIEDNTFYNCTSLKSVEITGKVTKIGDYAFNNCNSLESINLPEGLTYIGILAFADCTSLKSISVPESVTDIEFMAMGYCDSSDEDELVDHVNGFVIYGYFGSAAETYAHDNDITFKYSWFPDVSKSVWYYKAVKFNVDKGYFKGYANGYFGPANNIQRQDFVVLLSRIAGADLSVYEGKNGGFADVPTNDYYSAAVAWAKENNILSGYANGMFGVGDPITREQACKIFYNYCDGAVSGSAPTVLANYSDGAAVSDWAKDYVAWAAENHVVGGNGTLNPAGNANRAEMAQIIMNMSNNNIL